MYIKSDGLKFCAGAGALIFSPPLQFFDVHFKIIVFTFIPLVTAP